MCLVYTSKIELNSSSVYLFCGIVDLRKTFGIILEMYDFAKQMSLNFLNYIFFIIAEFYCVNVTSSSRWNISKRRSFYSFSYRIFDTHWIVAIPFSSRCTQKWSPESCNNSKYMHNFSAGWNNIEVILWNDIIFRDIEQRNPLFFCFLQFFSLRSIASWNNSSIHRYVIHSSLKNNKLNRSAAR